MKFLMLNPVPMIWKSEEFEVKKVIELRWTSPPLIVELSD